MYQKYVKLWYWVRTQYIMRYKITYWVKYMGCDIYVNIWNIWKYVSLLEIVHTEH